jgi:hypothetical protein
MRPLEDEIIDLFFGRGLRLPTAAGRERQPTDGNQDGQMGSKEVGCLNPL